MTKAELAKQAFEEACSPKTTAHHGGGAGRPYWNTQSFQYMYTPSFQFQNIPGCKQYRYTAVDEKGEMHCFLTDDASALLTPIWREIPEGVVELTVHALNEDGSDRYLVGARTFFKLASFPDDLPPAAIPYRECAKRAYDYAYNQTFIQHWLIYGTPDPDYDLNVYPNKMVCSVINNMLNYARLRPEIKENAMKIAVNAADFLLSITEPDGRPLAGIPPTYYTKFRPNPEQRDNITADERGGTIMMIYPPKAGVCYLKLEKITGDKKYYDAAMKIAEFYRDHIQPNGSWYLILDRETGEPTKLNYVTPLESVAPFLRAMYDRTGDVTWRELADRTLAYTEREQLGTYNWEGQFEDSEVSANYSNLTHYGAISLARYYVENYPDNPEIMERAKELMRFVEDQFVVWKRPAPWNKHHYDTSKWYTPAGLEQYHWHMPIDASTANILLAFLAFYNAGCGELYLAKARALADQITRMQQKESGRIPTEWKTATCIEDGGNFWMNCHFASASALAEFADYLDEHNL